ncbi:matrix metalloproteinase-25-like protein [Leptotrombidium deliense]|uniref:Matrix metalloproteinase-25-like protein n=1 Tax=Leptotrombidium deliense TaxID=299467 RepID=A0A443SG48_9ACAR|nr:matrix metalloproteinase-25-like protein [Leptotrombidium deliense]
MQKFGNIPETGRIDNATIALMNRKRCGLPDILSSNEYTQTTSRIKRYSLHGSKWQTTKLTWRSVLLFFFFVATVSSETEIEFIVNCFSKSYITYVQSFQSILLLQIQQYFS